jgi:hypothetical protein
MKFPYYLLAFIIALGSTNVAYALRNEGDVRGHHDEELNERDDEQLREFVESKRDIELEAKDENLSISGDVRFEYRSLYEKQDGRLLRGRHYTKDCKCVPLSHNDFDIEFNLRFDYIYGRAWASAHVQYDNTAGIERIDCLCSKNECCDSHERCGAGRGSSSRCQRKRLHGSGICDDLCLKRAYIGYNLWKDCDSKLDVEIGRRMLYDVFESEVQFLNRMDGIVLKYTDKWDCYTTWYAKGAVFIVDERTNHYAWAAEVAAFNINNSKFDLKYSIIDWRKYGKDRCGTDDPKGTKYLVSQLILTYHFPPHWFWCKPSEVYGGVLYNHLDGVGDLRLCCRDGHHHRGSKWGGYVGLTVGVIEKEGDWSFDVEYQYMGSRVVPWDDQSGIGLGNIREDCCDLIGPTIGFQGAHFEFLYALTDNLTIDTIVDVARSVDTHHHHNYSKVEIEAIYAF